MLRHLPKNFVSKHAVKNENSFRLLVKDGKAFMTTLGIALVRAVQNFSYYGVRTVTEVHIGRKPVFVLYSIAADCTVFLYSR